MMTMVKRGGVFVALLAVLLGTWLWGASGRRSPGRAFEAAELRNDVMAARTSLGAARADLAAGDVRAMSRHLEDVRRFVGHARMRLESLGWKDEAQRLDSAGFDADIDAAEHLGAWLDRRAQARARDAAATTDVVGLERLDATAHPTDAGARQLFQKGQTAARASPSMLIGP